MTPSSCLSRTRPDVLTFVFLPVLSPGKKKMSLYDSQAPICPICQVLLRPGELQEHMETEIERLANVCLRYACSHIYAHTQSFIVRSAESSLKNNSKQAVTGCLWCMLPRLKVLAYVGPK